MFLIPIVEAHNPTKNTIATKRFTTGALAIFSRPAAIAKRPLFNVT